MGDVCKRHPQNVVIAKCIACGEDICRECRDEFGYFCSKECLMKTKGSVDPLHKAKVKKSVQAGMRMERILSASVKIVFLAILLAIAWFSYAFFFSPYGKLVWTWNGDVSSDCNITPFEQGKLALLLNGSSSLIFDAMKCRTHINLGNSSLKSLNFCAGQLGSSVLLQGEGSVGILAGNGALTWFKEFKGLRIMHLAFNQDYIVALLSTDFSTLSKELEESAAAKRKPVQARPFLLCLKASDGSELWRKTLPPGESVNSLCAANGLFAYSGFSFDKNAYSGFLKVCGFAKGEVQWQVKLKNESEAQPFFAGDSLVFVNGGTLNAVSSDGASKLWSLKLGERYYLSENAYKISEDQLFILGGKGLACVDLKERKIAWESSLPCSPSELHVDAGRVFIVGYPGEGSTPLPEEVKPPTLESLKDADLNSAAILNKAAGSFKSSKPAVFAFDGKDGKELWRKEHLLGSLVCGDGRLAFIYDSAKTQMASIIGGTLKGDMCITQLAPASGKEIVSGSDKIGMEAPYAICGEMLLGVVYDRDSSTTTLGMGKAPPIRKLGFAAFKLK